MKTWTLALLLSGCVVITPPLADCVTPCGMRLARGDSAFPGWSCPEFNNAEAQILGLLKTRTLASAEPDDRLLNACPTLKGYVISLQPKRVWTSEADGRWVAGQTFCFRGPPLIQVSGLQRPHEGALLHEMAHAAQGCFAAFTVDPGKNDEHANWTRAGIVQAEDDYYRSQP